MTHALELAGRGLHTTQPNPRVGCVIAHAETVVGMGWHQRAGDPHAEVFALREAGALARGATAYVTLEPCSHFGRTPPCADALIAAGIARVVVAADDPNPRVAGAGLARLAAAGVAVETGLLRDAARDLNRGFHSRFERDRPWVRIKAAISLDGRNALASGESKWITGEAARTDVQEWRARSSAIMTGIGTVIADDPRLTVRREALRDHGEFVPPLRVVLDSRLRMPRGLQVLDGGAPTHVLHCPGATPVDDRFTRAKTVAIAADAQGRPDLVVALRHLAHSGVNELQVEAGARLCGALIDRDLVDELIVYIAPVLLGDRSRPFACLAQPASIAAARRLQLVEHRQLGDDVLLLYRCAADRSRA